MILVSIVDNFTDKAILQWGCVKHGGELTVKDYVLPALVQFLSKIVLLVIRPLDIEVEFLL